MDASEILRNLNFQQVMTFFALTESGSFTKAAEQLHMSQAAISRIIAKLEQETGLILFVRKARMNVPTPAGRVLYKEWKQAFRELETGYEAAYEAQLGNIRNLRIGSNNQNISHQVSVLNWFEEQFPEYSVSLECDQNDVLIERLIAGELDMLFLNSFEARYMQSLGIKSRQLFEEPCYIYIHNSHPLYHKETITEEDLKGLDYTFWGTNHIFASPMLQKFCRKYGLDFHNIYVEHDYKKAMISFLRKTGIYFSEFFFEEGRMGDIRKVLLSEITSGAVVAWVDGNIDQIIPMALKFTNERHEQLMENYEKGNMFDFPLDRK